jgi:8-oxo-dGTP pyrophosphatase MutT (NUDIX family)
MSDYYSQIRKLVGTRPLIVCSAGVIILDHMNRVLLHHRTDNNMWGIPGGALEPGERLEDAAVREVEEEVGVKCGSLQLFGIYAGPEMYYRYPNGDEVHDVSVIYLCREFSGEVQVDLAEGKEAAFFFVADIPTAINPLDRPAIHDLRRKYREIVKGANAARLPISERCHTVRQKDTPRHPAET